MRALLLLLLLPLLAACGGRVDPLTPGTIPALPAMGADLPAGSANYANDDLAELFTRLTHDMEWGASRPHLVRFEVPVRVSLEGTGSAAYAPFLDELLGLLRRHAALDIARVETGGNVRVRFVNGREMERALPAQACVVIIGDTEWDTYLSDPVRFGGQSLVEAESIEAATIFIPQTAAPYQIRRCLIEEVVQALGPANDIFGVADTIFNDDSAHGWPTRLDLLMLRLLYAPEMRTGLSRAETRAEARRLLGTLNPGGEAPGARRLGRGALTDPYGWVALNQHAHRIGESWRSRVSYAREALTQIARREPGSLRHCYSLGELGDLYARRDPEQALRYYERAERVCVDAVGAGDIRVARLRLNRAGSLIWLERWQEAIALLEPLVARFAAHADEAALARSYAILGTAYLETGQDALALIALTRAEAWGGYAFGTDEESVVSLGAALGRR